MDICQILQCDIIINMKKPMIIRFIEMIKKTFHVQTYVIEYVFVASILITVAVVARKGWI